MSELNEMNKEREEADKKFTQGILAFQKRAVDSQVWRCCLNCLESNHLQAPLCRRFKCVPPLDVVVVGCEFWTPDIPF